MEFIVTSLPPQQVSMKKKNDLWRKKHLDWADSKTFFNYSLVRKSVIHKKINYDLLNGKLHMQDIELILNPDQIQAGFIPNKIQHYPIINSKLDLLVGEEIKRIFDYRVIITNPNAVSEIENNKKQEVLQRLKDWVSKTGQSNEESEQELDSINEYFTYEWQDMREVRANCLLNHYSKELNMSIMFQQGFKDALTVGEEIYICSIVGGEPRIERVNPLKIRVFKSGYSNRVEDADMVIIEDYWSPGKIIDTYYDVLKEKDRKYIEQMPNNLAQSSVDSMDNVDERYGFVNGNMLGEEMGNDSFFWDPFGSYDGVNNSLLPYDMSGNIRVLRMFWKSRRKIKKIKKYDQISGEPYFQFYDENYVCNEDEGEEEQIFWINQAWEGTKIGKDVYVNMRPCPIQYNSLSNPSRCHFGIIGSIYNDNDNKPFCLTDRLKPYAYLYDVIHDRLNKVIARSWGSLVQIDFAKMPKGWDMEKYLYYAKTMGIAVIDSFKEGNYGAAAGKIAGALNNNSTGVIPAADSQQIQQLINYLEWIKQEMTEVSGISKQREGAISNRETVGGVERATLQSSHITERLFSIHENVKKRALECFLETAKIAMKGNKKKFQYILSDNSMQIMDIDGDEFAECDYGLVVDCSNQTQELNQKIDMLAQAALQNQTLNFSTIMKLYSSASMAEKQRTVENNERNLQEQQQRQQQQQIQMQQQQMEQQQLMAQAQMEQQAKMNSENNETKIIVAEINSQAEAQRFAMMAGDGEDVYTQKDKEELNEKIRQFDAKLKLEKEKLDFDKLKHKQDNELKDKISIRQSQKKTSFNK